MLLPSGATGPTAQPSVGETMEMLETALCGSSADCEAAGVGVGVPPGAGAPPGPTARRAEPSTPSTSAPSRMMAAVAATAEKQLQRVSLGHPGGPARRRRA